MYQGECDAFYSTPQLRVERSGVTDFKIRSSANPTIKDELNFCDRVCLHLASKGWCDGNPEAIAKSKVSWVMKMLDYQKFTRDFQEEREALQEVA